MNLAEIDTNLQELIQNFNADSFIYDLLLAYGTPNDTIKRLQQGGLNMSKVAGEILWKKKLFFKSVKGEDLHELIAEIKTDERVIRQNPRFIIVTNYETLLAIDTKNDETLDIPILDIAKHIHFFFPMAGMEKSNLPTENPADVKAAERMAKLYDEIKKDNETKTPEEIHNLNVFLSRLLFCFFAEDTGIFEHKLFTNSIGSHTQADGSDLNTYLDKLFEVMNTDNTKRQNLAAYLSAFPYVNGGLFRNKHQAPVFTRASRKAVIESGALDWSAINPDIFGSMIQAVITPEHRGGLGMHYTSVPNIMKVIEPLFLNELYGELEAAEDNPKKLKALLQIIWNIKIFDPACGSGNFLIIAYKELRKLEMKIFKELKYLAFSEICLGNFYGIEIDDFAHGVAILSLWLAEHQMNQEFLKEFGRTKPALPLMETGNIVHGNATRIDWETVCPKNVGDEIYILGNPPYLGSSLQSPKQKEDMAFVFKENEGYKNLDYISCWFFNGANYITNIKANFAFVSTNSICQGEQVALLWPLIFKKNVEIAFAYTSFKWKNNAKANAGVSVVIVGLHNKLNNYQKFIILNDTKIAVSNISPYLTRGEFMIVEKRSKPISMLQEMSSGIKVGDGGNLILNEDQKEILIREYPQSINLIKNYIGADDFINGGKRFCLWVTDENVNLAYSIPTLKIRFDKCRELRLESKKEATRKKAKFPHQFDENTYIEADSILIPQTGSERRNYIPIGFLTAGSIISNAARVIYNPETHLFSIISSRMHIVWIKAVAGRLKTDMQYSNTLCYNTFPFPSISDIQIQELEKHVYNIIDERKIL